MEGDNTESVLIDFIEDYFDDDKKTIRIEDYIQRLEAIRDKKARGE